MNYSSAFFEGAFATAESLPESLLPEFCFSGRSNVGKSSLINSLLGRKSIARVSSTPGKTVTVNFYRVGEIRLVDLPGYGYAKITDKEKIRFSQLTENYFASGRNIRRCFQLVDMRRLPTKDDIEMLKFLKYYGMPYTVVLTKCDKLGRSETEKMLAAIRENLGVLGEGVELVPFSSLKKTGVETLRRLIEE